MPQPRHEKLFEIDPFTDARWQQLVESHPQSSVFHDTGWVRALALTYGYRPVAFTTSPPDSPLANGILFCELRSWLTGHRLVSLPFTDSCSPLVSDESDWRTILSLLRAHPPFTNCRFAEIRGIPPSSDDCSDLCTLSAQYYQHSLSLKASLQDIYGGFHQSCIQRKIRRAEKEGLRVECGRSDALVEHFYRLLIQTRQRHGLPPQPVSWFKNIASTMGEKLRLRMAFQGNLAVAGIITLTNSRTMVYKYGASDAAWHKLGGIPLLMWDAIQEARENNLRIFDFGRTDLHDDGLCQFKERYGAERSQLTYYRVSNPKHAGLAPRVAVEAHAVRKLFQRLPTPILEMFGRILYRHVG